MMLTFPKALRDKVLVAIAQEQERITDSRLPDAMAICEGLGLDKEDASELLKILEDEGLIELHLVMNLGASARLTPNGRKTLETLIS